MDHTPIRLDAGLAGEVEVGFGDVGPVRLVFDADRAATQVYGFNEGGADPAHRVEHEIAGLGVVGDGLCSDGGQHLGRVRGGLSCVAALALGGGSALRGRPHRHSRGRCRLVGLLDERARDRHGRRVVGGVVTSGVGHGVAFLDASAEVGGVAVGDVIHRMSPVSRTASAGDSDGLRYSWG